MKCIRPSLARQPHAEGKASAVRAFAWWRRLRVKLRKPAPSARHQGSTSLAVFEFSELPELERMFGRPAARRLVARILRLLRGIDRDAGHVIRTTPTTFAVLLRGYDADQARAAVDRTLGPTGAIESGRHGDELMVVPDFLVRGIDRPRESVRAVYRQMVGQIAEAQDYEKRRDCYLKMERESYQSAAGRLQASRSELLPLPGSSAADSWW